MLTELGSEIGHRFLEFCDIVDQVSHALVMDGSVSTKGLNVDWLEGVVGQIHPPDSGQVYFIGVIAHDWATLLCPTPW